MTTLISHFYNEEYLLPWWLMHHTQLFDHGILINRGSTDRSVEICRQYAPHWEVRDSRFQEFDAFEVDSEVMDIETEVTGWKMVLNTTEFLCCRDKAEFFSSLDNLGENMYFIRNIILIDDPNHGYSDPVYTLPLVKQRYHGYFPGEEPINYGRFIHNHINGSYSAGRHGSSHESVIYSSPAFVLKFWFSPWNDAIRKRKLQIGPTFSARSIQYGQALQHLFSPEELENRYNHHVSRTQDLRLNPEYQQLFFS